VKASKQILQYILHSDYLYCSHVNSYSQAVWYDWLRFFDSYFLYSSFLSLALFCLSLWSFGSVTLAKNCYIAKLSNWHWQSRINVSNWHWQWQINVIP
jgi:hypothetical protein